MSEQTGEVLDANAARVWKCLTAREGMVNPVAEIARLREDNAKMLEIQAMLNEQALELSTERWNAQADLREALDALERMGRAYAALLVFASQGRLTAADLRAAEIEPLPLTWHTEDGAPCVDEPVLCKHGRAV